MDSVVPAAAAEPCSVVSPFTHCETEKPDLDVPIFVSVGASGAAAPDPHTMGLDVGHVATEALDNMPAAPAFQGEVFTAFFDSMLQRLLHQQTQHETSIEHLLLDHQMRLKEIIGFYGREQRQSSKEVPNGFSDANPYVPRHTAPPPIITSPSSCHPSALPPPTPPSSHAPPPLPDSSPMDPPTPSGTLPVPGIVDTPRSSKGPGRSISCTSYRKSNLEEYAYKASKSLENQSRRQSGITDIDLDDMDEIEDIVEYWFLRRACRHVMQRREFELLTTSLIILNAVSIGLSADWAVQHVGEETPGFHRIIEVFFIIVFSLELIIRVVGEGIQFISLKNSQLKWNVFDSFVVFAAGAEEFFLLVVGSQSSLTYLRVLRLLRIVRVLRVVRVMKFFAELRCMVAGIANSLKALLWCIVLLIMLMYMFSLLFLQEIAANLNENFAGGVESGPEASVLLGFFGSLMQSMDTLLRSTTSGNSWGEVADVLFDINAPLGLLFTFYFSFVFFCVFNVVTSVFVEHANSFNKMDLDNMALEESSRRNQLVDEMRGLFNADCVSDSDELSLYEFILLIQKPPVQAYFRHLGLHVARDNAGALFNLIDIDGSGKVSLGEFVDGCSQFVGQARQLDIARLRHETRMLSMLITDFIDATSGQRGINAGLDEDSRESHAAPEQKSIFKPSFTYRRLTVDGNDASVLQMDASRKTAGKSVASLHNGTAGEAIYDD